MDLENLKIRLSEIEKSIEEKNKLIQQNVADLNVLLGCKNECVYWMQSLINPVNTVTKDELKEMLGATSIELVDSPVNQ